MSKTPTHSHEALLSHTSIESQENPIELYVDPTPVNAIVQNSADLIRSTAEFSPRHEFIIYLDEIEDRNLINIGGKGANLVRLKRAGLPVPNGYCITINAHNYYIKNGKLPAELISEVIKAKKKLGGKVAIRSSANCEDGSELSMAGVFQSYYVYKDEEVSDAIIQIYNQAHSSDVEKFMALHGKSKDRIRMSLIIQELIEPEMAGVIYTGINGDNILVQYVDGFGANLVDGVTQGSAMLIDGNSVITESTGFETRPLPPSAVQQIQYNSQSIAKLFPDIPQDIEFAYREGKVYIVQARPLTTNIGNIELRETPEDCLEATKRKIRKLIEEEKTEMSTKTAIFSDANYSELLPKPTEMDIGMYMYVWGGSDGIPGATQIGRSEMGYLVGKEATGIINYLGGRTYSSISRYSAIYHIGFPETRKEYFNTLVNEYLETIQADPSRGAYPQMGLLLQDPSLEDLKIRFGDKAEEYYQTYLDFAKRMRGFADEFLTQFYDNRLPATTEFVNNMQHADLKEMRNEQLVQHINTILEHIRTFSYVDFVKAARLGFYYSQRLQDLLKQNLGLSNDQVQAMYSRLNQGLDGSAITDANITISQTKSEEEALRIALSLIGHFSTGEMLEIRHPPLKDVPEALTTYVRGIRQIDYKQQFERQKEVRLQAQENLLSKLSGAKREEMERVIRSSQTYMALRETAKYLFTKEYLLVRDTLEEIEQRLELETGDIFFVYPREIDQLVSNPLSMLHLIKARKQSFKNYEKLDMPNVIRESDVDNLGLTSENNGDLIEATGKFLAEGPQFEGIIINLNEFTDMNNVNLLMSQYRKQEIPIILVATQMNLSHDPYIAQASGLVIENAGIVAHGAQRARELGKGAIGGIKSKQLQTGMRVFFDPINRSIKKTD